MSAFDYSNLNDRPPGPVVTWGSRLSRGVRSVQAQVGPYAHAWEEHNRASLAVSGPLWVVLGDSMAQGVGASTYDGGWPGRLAERVPALWSYRMVNLSRYGARVADVVDLQLPAMAGLGVEPDLVTVVVGSNDLIGRRRRAAMLPALDLLLARLPVGAVVASQPGARRPGVEDFNRRLEVAVRERGLVEADFRDPAAISWRGRVAADHFHPNDAGYDAMAGVLAPVVTKLLRRRPG